MTEALNLDNLIDQIHKRSQLEIVSVEGGYRWILGKERTSAKSFATVELALLDFIQEACMDMPHSVPSSDDDDVDEDEECDADDIDEDDDDFI